MKHYVGSTLHSLVVAAAFGSACAQDYPHKPVRIVTAEAGGGLDFVARLLAPGLTRNLGFQVIVDNRPGMVSADVAARASPDGHTLMLSGSTILLAPLFQKTSYDPVRDFSPISLATTSPNLLVVTPSLPVGSVKELIALAKARPGELNYGSAATGSTAHLSGELFKSLAAVNIVRVNYKGTGSAIIALLGGEVQLLFAPAGSVMPHVKSGKLRALAVTSAQPSVLFPGLPTIAASGLPGYESAAITSLSAPARTPASIVSRLNREVAQILAAPDLRERFALAGAEAVSSSPEQLAAMVKSELARWGKLVRGTGIGSQ